MRNLKKTISVLLAALQIVFALPQTGFAANGDITAALDFSTIGSNSVVTGNTSTTYLQLGTGSNEGKLEVKSNSAVTTNRLSNSDFSVNGGSFNLSFKAKFNSLIENVHCSYWNYNGLGLQLSFVEPTDSTKKRTYRVNFNKLSTANNTVNVVVGKGGESFPLYGNASNFSNMTVDLTDPTAEHTWKIQYDSVLDEMTILLDGNRIKSNNSVIDPVSMPWFKNTSTTFNQNGLTITNLLVSTSTSYIAAGTNNNVLLDDIILKEGLDVSVADIADDSWGNVYEGYESTVRQYTVTNGPASIGDLNITSSSSDFEIKNLSDTVLLPSKAATFEVKLATGLHPANYSATISVRDGTLVLDTFDVSATVLGDTTAWYECNDFDSPVTLLNNDSNYITLASGTDAGKVSVKTISAQKRDNGIVDPNFNVNGGSFTLSFDADFNSLIENTHASYWNYNGLGVQLCYNASGVLKTYRVNFTKLDTVNNTVHVVVAKGGASFNFAGNATNFSNMTVDLANPTSLHTWTFKYDSSQDNMTILIDGVKIKSGGTELSPVSTPWINNTNTVFNSTGLTVSNVLYSTSTSYVAAGTNNDVLLDNFVLKNTVSTTLCLARNEGALPNNLKTAGVSAYNTHLADSEIKVENGSIISNLNTSVSRAAQLFKYDQTFVAGAGSWDLNFDASFASLVTVLSNLQYGYNGVGVQMNVAGTDGRCESYRINFNNIDTANNTVKLYMSKAASNVSSLADNSLYNVYTVSLNDPSAVHNLKMSYNQPTDTLSVSIDGTTVANAANAGFQNYITDPVDARKGGLYLSNVIYSTSSVDMAKAGNNVTFDNFKLERPDSSYQQLVNDALDGVTLASIKGNNPGMISNNKIVTNLNLPENRASLGVDFDWQSSNETVISNEGIVNRPNVNQSVTMTVTATKGGITASKNIVLLVMKSEAAQSLTQPQTNETTSFIDTCEDLDSKRWARGHTRNYYSFVESSQKSALYELPIPEGRYMIYQRPSTPAQSRILKTNVIADAGAFLFELDAKLIELAAPKTSESSSHKAFTGLGLGATASGRSYFANINNMNNGYIDIYIATNNIVSGSPVDMASMTYQKTTVAFDNSGYEYHKWGLAFDGYDSVSVLLDGQAVASAVITDMRPSSLLAASGVYIYGNNLYADTDVDDNTNLIYLDNIALRKDYKISGTAEDPSSSKDNFKTTVNISSHDNTYESGLTLHTDLLSADGATVIKSSTNDPAVTDSDTISEISNVGEQGSMIARFRLMKGNKMLAEYAKSIYLLPSTQEVYANDSLTVDSQNPPEEQPIYRFDLDLISTDWASVNFTNATGGGTGKVLYNTTGSSEIEIPVTLNGWFGIYVGTLEECEQIKMSVVNSSTVYSKQVNYASSNTIAVDQTKTITDSFIFAKNFDNEKVLLKVPDSGKRSALNNIKFIALTDQQVSYYGLDPDAAGSHREVMIDDDGFSGFGSRFTDRASMRAYIDQIAGTNFDNLSFCMGTSTGLNYNSAYAGECYANSTSSDSNWAAVQAMRNIIAEGETPPATTPTAEVLATYGDSHGVNVYANLRMNFNYASNDSLNCMNGEMYEYFCGLTGGLLSDNTSLNYENTEVRNYFLSILNEISQFEGVDGVILDFTRYPEYINDTDTITRRAFVTAFMGSVRQTLGSAANITVKIIRDEAYDPAAIGDMDIAQWIGLGYVDSLIISDKSRELMYDASSYVDLVTAENAAHSKNVKVYAAIISAYEDSTPLSKNDYLLRALDLYNDGIDGIMVGTIIPSSGNANLEYSILDNKNELQKWWSLSYHYSLNNYQINLHS